MVVNKTRILSDRYWLIQRRSGYNLNYILLAVVNQDDGRYGLLQLRFDPANKDISLYQICNAAPMHIDYYDTYAEAQDKAIDIVNLYQREPMPQNSYYVDPGEK